jgi:hypothetical protein
VIPARTPSAALALAVLRKAGVGRAVSRLYRAARPWLSTTPPSAAVGSARAAIAESGSTFPPSNSRAQDSTQRTIRRSIGSGIGSAPFSSSYTANHRKCESPCGAPDCPIGAPTIPESGPGYVAAFDKRPLARPETYPATLATGIRVREPSPLHKSRCNWPRKPRRNPGGFGGAQAVAFALDLWNEVQKLYSVAPVHTPDATREPRREGRLDGVRPTRSLASPPCRSSCTTRG